jgi:hypothetical protein
MNSDDLVFFGKMSLYGLFVIAILVIFVVISIIQHRNRKKHNAEMRAFAARYGWQFYDEFDFPFLRELAQYTGKIEKGLFGETIPNPLTVRSKNVIQGNMHGRNFAVFEQTYVVSSGKHRTVRSQTLFAVEVRDMNLPVFSLEPDSFEHFLSWNNIKKLDIDFYTHPQFSRNYLLYGLDERAVRRLFQPPVLNFYEQNPLFTTIAGGKYLVIYQHGEVYSPEQILIQLNFLYALVNVFKSAR